MDDLWSKKRIKARLMFFNTWNFFNQEIVKLKNIQRPNLVFES